ncbi:achaete-scute transcription factor-related [Holotrichia oblita]|uniref:Achaete-scute transcription factor-related n=1 Tax=Holotrichia oblita TaxID=644536 RepID=A0ACB9T7K1_HOLOL|nr:achaete-scute transcription factor-related [Holotrichia oblita]
MSMTCNIISTPSICCTSFANSSPWTCLHDYNRQYQREWMVELDHVTVPQYSENSEKDRQMQDDEMSTRALKENNCKKGIGKYVHVPHRDKPPQVVAKRNARERRRVQAVNSAFTRLRKAVPLDNNSFRSLLRTSLGEKRELIRDGQPEQGNTS